MKSSDQFGQATLPGKFLVDVIPARTYGIDFCDVEPPSYHVSVRHIPSWLPGGGWRSIADQYKLSLDEVREIPREYAKQQIVSRPASLCQSR